MILILGGTAQGRLAVQAADESGNAFFYSTKGALQEVVSHNGIRLTGGMNTKQMELFCKENEIELLVNAAHPFAEQLHKTIYEVSCVLNIPVVRVEREYPMRSSDIIWCDNYLQAVRKMQNNGVHRLLALTGVNTILPLKPFWENTPQSYFRVLNREESIEIAKKNGFPMENLIFFKNGTDDVISNIKPDAIITKESGVEGFFNEKVESAKRAGVEIYAIKRPILPKEFINVYGPIGLRKKIEELVPLFFHLRIGYTTGTCATAATIGALHAVLYNKELKTVFVTLPSLERVELPIHFTSIPYRSNFPISCFASCSVIKDAGDDPDITNACEIISTVEVIISNKNITNTYGSDESVKLSFLQGVGVGKITLPGLGLEIGEPAINFTPRQMIKNEVNKILTEYNNNILVNFKITGINVTIAVKDGLELAKRTFNSKLGIVDGISIIGTSGVVRPFSKEAFLGSIKKEIEVAIAVGGRTLVINSGAKSEKAIKEYVKKIRSDDKKPELPMQSFIHYGNFIGDTIVIASSLGINEIILGIMLGKAVKLAEGNLDTHSKVVTMNKEFLKQVAYYAGCSKEVYNSNLDTPCIIDKLTLARELWNALSASDSQKFFQYLKILCYKHCAPLFPNGKLSIILIPEC
ncbi:MAG: cobalt-precorrin-5B (C(1))-methyltransferase CbiD [Bacteroidales bacterium]